MIRKTRCVKMMEEPEKEAWLYTGICLVGLKLQIPAGVRKFIYFPTPKDFLCDGKDIPAGKVVSLKSVTIIAPGGEIDIYNEALDEPSRWKGSLLPVGYGIHPSARVSFEGVKDSTMHCLSPRDNLKGFHDKDLHRVTLKAGEDYTFGARIIGFAIVYGDGEFEGFLADPGDTYTATTDSVIAVVTYKEENQNENQTT